MSLINEKYQKVVCICLKEREDKYNYIKSKFEKYNIQVEFYRPVIPGYASKLIEPYSDKHNRYEINDIFFNKQFPNELGAMQSHYHVIKTALLEGVENLFVFEDDCSFQKDWNELLPKYFNTIPKDAHGILLYSFMDRLYPENIKVSSRWTKGFGSWSLLAYGLNKEAMEAYIKIQDDNPMIADRATLKMMTYMNFNFYTASPPLVIPSKTLTSSIRGENKNYEKIRSIFMLGIDDKNYE